MKLWLGFGMGIALFLGMGPDPILAAAPANDRFSNRITLTGTNVTVAASNAGATKETGEPDHSGNAGGSSVWWTWTSPTDGEVQITTDGSSFDTLLGAYTGTKVSSLTGVASNDDHGFLSTSRVRFEARQGTEYQIAVDGYSDGMSIETGSVRLQLTFVSGPFLRPTNDLFANRISLAGFTVTTNASNAQATREVDEPIHALKLGDTSIWFTWTAPAAGAVRISTAGSSFDTLLAIYSGSSLTSLIEVASSDDIDEAGGILTSAATFDAQAGQSFQVAVDGFDGATGTVALRIEMTTTGLTAPQRLSDGRFQFSITGASNRTYAVEASGNLTLWTGIGSVFNTNGTVLFTDPVARNLRLRFYRVSLQ